MAFRCPLSTLQQNESEFTAFPQKVTLAGGGGGSLHPPQEPHPAVGPSGLNTRGTLAHHGATY